MVKLHETQYKRPQLAKPSISRAVLCVAFCAIPSTRETKSLFAPFAVWSSLSFCHSLHSAIHFPGLAHPGIRELRKPTTRNQPQPSGAKFTKSTSQPPTIPMDPFHFPNTSRQNTNTFSHNGQAECCAFLVKSADRPANKSENCFSSKRQASLSRLLRFGRLFP